MICQTVATRPHGRKTRRAHDPRTAHDSHEFFRSWRVREFPLTPAVGGHRDENKIRILWRRQTHTQRLGNAPTLTHTHTHSTTPRRLGKYPYTHTRENPRLALFSSAPISQLNGQMMHVLYNTTTTHMMAIVSVCDGVVFSWSAHSFSYERLFFFLPQNVHTHTLTKRERDGRRRSGCGWWC